MGIAAWWPRLRPETRGWLIEHNDEPVDPSIVADIVSVTGGTTDPSWWTGELPDGSSQLTDDAIDWIDAVANGENPAAS